MNPPHQHSANNSTFAANEESNLNSHIIRKISSYLQPILHNNKDIIAGILTGSFSREEGSILVQSSGNIRVLGDVEFIIIMHKNANINNIAGVLHSAEKTISNKLEKQNITCRIELSPVRRNYLTRLKPTIFNYELFLNGKVIYGDKHIIKEIPPISPSQIPPFDAFFLLCNRIVEQLSLFSKLSNKSLTGLEAYYQLVKLYMDIAGSYLIITGRYVPSYYQRNEIFSQLPVHESFLSKKYFLSFINRLNEMTHFKLNPQENKQFSISHEELIDLFHTSREYALKLWNWEESFLISHKKYSKFRESSSVLKSFSLRTKVHGWLKFQLIAWRIKEPLRYHKILKHFFLSTPQMLIYHAAANLYFNLNKPDISLNLKDFLAFLPIKTDVTGQEQAIHAVVDAWNKFVRSA